VNALSVTAALCDLIGPVTESTGILKPLPKPYGLGLLDYLLLRCQAAKEPMESDN
jgi:hypothetical protein